jgi:hypothetical protein
VFDSTAWTYSTKAYYMYAESQLQTGGVRKAKIARPSDDSFQQSSFVSSAITSLNQFKVDASASDSVEPRPALGLLLEIGTRQTET